MIPTKIFLDLDDVLNKFTLYALHHVGCPIDPAKGYDQYDSKHGWDIVKAANALHLTRHFTVESFWDSFCRKTWRDVPVSKELPYLLQWCEELVGKDNICILTSPVFKDKAVNSPGCLDGKYDWIRENLPEWLHRQFLIGPCKYFCAQPNALLIDDAQHNIEAFQRAGGLTLLVPRPWNHLREKDTIGHLKRSLQRFFNLKGWFR